MSPRLLIIGGTDEARRLAAAVHGRMRTVSSLAGRVNDPRLPEGEVRIGGFGGPGGLADWLRAERVDVVVDASHPFAARMTASAVAAAERAGVPLLVLRRPGWTAAPGDDWRWTATLEEAAALLPAVGSRAFLTTGRRSLAVFAHLSGVWFLARSVDTPEPPFPPRMEVLLSRGPYTREGELALMRGHRIDVVVTKDSGGAMTSAKLAAARELSLPVVVVRRPPPPPGVRTASTVGEAVAWLDAILVP
ncbi:precorrin-6A reductase [Acrocarpospora phusangensis]|uniref:Precorrin-6A reductase n=1 Tax=Acrocarpospora phusangensis TaxID=1070424 RepID=A0A919UP75_9ACTN|nr:cobalt-precorrin-6A reductase [Acrocarpospora phusangensis]GIH28594.1 precorrin-6A reductase [Acrocarpospora phusangensis]